jgi:hypothetical protein
VTLGDAVDEATEAHGKTAHIESLLAAQQLQCLFVDEVAQYAIHQCVVELISPGSNRCMRREITA